MFPLLLVIIEENMVQAGCPYVSNYVWVHVVQAGWLAVLMKAITYVNIGIGLRT